MLPISLSIEGLYSYKEPQVIDFKRLTDAQVFGIFGATGSGKSSILEAISFVLYGETERLNKADERNYNMMNLDYHRTYIDFEFSTGKSESDHYRFTYEAYRNKKQFKKIEKSARKAYQWLENAWIPISVKSAEEILGLSYDNFKRTIIIPQGKFQDFLQLGGSARTDMLKEIFQLERYDLSRKAENVDKHNQEAIAQKEGLFALLAYATPELIAEKEEEWHQNNELYKQNALSIQQKEKEEKLLDKLKEIFSQLESVKKELERLQAQAPEVEGRRKRLLRYENCLQNFQQELELRDKRTKTYEDNHKTLLLMQQELKKHKDELPKTERVFLHVEEMYAKREDLKGEKRELETIKRLKQNEDGLTKIRERITKGEVEVEKVKDTIRNYRSEIASMDTAIENEKANKPSIEVLMTVRDWFSHKEMLQKELQLLEKQLIETEKQAEAEKAKKLLLLKKTNISPNQYHLPTDTLLQFLTEEGEALQLQLQKLLDAHNQLSVKEALKNYAADLQDGEACPLCGSLHHPNVLHIQELSAHKKAIKAEISQIQATQKIGAQVEAELKTVTAQIEKITLLSLEKQKEIAQKRQEVQAWETRFVWAEFRGKDRQFIDNEVEKIKALEQKITNMERERAAKQKAAVDEEKKQNKYEEALKKLQQDNNAIEVQYRVDIKSLQQKKYGDYEKVNEVQINLEIRKLEEQYQSLEKQYLTTKNELQRLRDEVQHLAGKIEMSESQQRNLQIEIARMNLQLNEKLAASEFNDFGEVEKVLQQRLNTAREKKELEAFDLTFAKTKDRHNELSLATDNQSFDALHYQQLKTDIYALKQQQQERARTLGALQTQLDKLRADNEQKAEIQKGLNALYNRRENIDTLKKLFRAKGFVNFVLTVFLQNLKAAANYRFAKLTNNALHLDITETNDFIVKDYLNNGETRSIKTLSGGQTFQAALSLALSLADSVQQQAQFQQNFFFIDEGFGSQDKDSLRMIFNTLQALQRENRIVGIISHVEDLQQEIDTFLTIKNDKSKGSLIVESWNE